MIGMLYRACTVCKNLFYEQVEINGFNNMCRIGCSESMENPAFVAVFAKALSPLLPDRYNLPPVAKNAKKI